MAELEAVSRHLRRHHKRADGPISVSYGVHLEPLLQHLVDFAKGPDRQLHVIDAENPAVGRNHMAACAPQLGTACQLLVSDFHRRQPPLCSRAAARTSANTSSSWLT